MIAGLALGLALCIVAPQQPLGSLRIERGPAGARVTAHRAGLPCDVALQELATAMGWTLRYQSDGLRAALAGQTVDLAVEDEDPRSLAKLLALAGGADLAFFEREVDGVARVDVSVVGPADGSTAMGRDRLRGEALSWYRGWLDQTLRAGESGGDEGRQVRWQVAELLRAQGDLEGAARLYAVLSAGSEHELLPQARLRLASTLFELGEDRWTDAERELRELVRLHPEHRASCRAMVLLARLMIDSGRHRECAQFIEHSYLRLSGTVEMTDAQLLMAELQLELGDIERAQEAMRQLEASRPVRSLDRPLRRRAWMLRGLIGIEAGTYAAAVDDLTSLVKDGGLDGDQRLRALVALGEASLGDGRFLQAAAVSAMAAEQRTQLGEVWQQRSIALEAQVALSLGDEERGFELLEDAIRGQEPGRLDLLLAEQLLEHGRLQWAREVAERLSEQEPRWADRARLVLIEVRFANCHSEEQLARALGPAAEQVAGIRSEAVRSEAEELLAGAAMQIGVAPPAGSGKLGPHALVESALQARRDARSLRRVDDLEAADSLEAGAIEHFARARGELQALATGPNPPLSVLFDLARCEEALGRIEAACEIWQRIVRRDRSSVGGGESVAGPWGRAAGTAMTVARWVDSSRGWTLPVDVDTIRWEAR